MIPLIIIKLLKYIFGYVNIKVESVFIERFINICISKKILIWNINRKNATTLYANIGIKDFKNIKGIARKTKSKIQMPNTQCFQRADPFRGFLDCLFSCFPMI